MKKCPNCGCEEFFVTAHVTQDWLVNSNGDFMQVENTCVEVTHQPNNEDLWICADCGYDGAGDKFETNEEVEEMKKYTIDNYKEFCSNALLAPPIEEFEEGRIDEAEWYKANRIHITVGNHNIELDYCADNVNEIEYALREMYEAEYDGPPTTGNTVGSEYRPAELKDVVRYFIMWRYENYGGLNWFDYAQQAVVEMSDIQSVIGVYEEARKVEKDIDFKCNWHNFKIESLKDATEAGIKKIILDLVGSNIEISYDAQTDKSFVIDYTFKESGDFIDWSWGGLDQDGINQLVSDYKAQIFEEN